VNCVEAEAHLVDAGDGRLDLSLQMRLAAHLDGCAACRERAASWRQLVPAMRGLAPEIPDPMRVRRMQIEIERQLAPAAPIAAGARWRWLRWPATVGLAGAAALLLLLGTRHLSRPLPGTGTPDAPDSPSYAVVTSVEGQLMSEGQAVAPASPLAGGSRLVLAAQGRAELALGRAARVRFSGPTQVVLGGTARAIAVRLEGGTIDAEVAHRSAGETFAVMTRDLRVEVRGTRFSVGAKASESTSGSSAGSSPGSWVRVDEGRVEVALSDGHRQLVSAGETLVWPPPPASPALSPPPPSTMSSSSSSSSAPPRASEPMPRELTPSCAEARRSCEATARAARDSMRAGDHPQALRLLAAAARDRHHGRVGVGCGGASVAACEDELGYLRAEALRGAGRIDAAIAAYHGLDGRRAPPAMRQNALYAAAELEARRGHAARARTDYERALAAAPRGALGAESLLGAAESARSAGDGTAAVSLARRYLDEFPAGLGVARARRIVDGRE
jgi:tetratricopeptide (TPR) repeat protein